MENFPSGQSPFPILYLHDRLYNPQPPIPATPTTRYSLHHLNRNPRSSSLPPNNPQQRISDSPYPHSPSTLFPSIKHLDNKLPQTQTQSTSSWPAHPRQVPTTKPKPPQPQPTQRQPWTSSMSDLLSSRWAPGASSGYRYTNTYNNHHTNNYPRRPHSENRIRSAANDHNHPSSSGANATTLLPPAQELTRFTKIVARLRWKLPFLAEGYRLATQTASAENGVSEAQVAHAEIMFKIDFYEYYALLERAIVHLLGVFNIAVSSSYRDYRGENGSGSGNGYGRGVGIHRYHANVLQALEEETTPLTPILGSGYVHALLQKAKELRNRWKTADMTVEEREDDPNDPYERKGRKEIPPLKSFNFDEIFMGIFEGLEEGYVRARAHVEMCRRPGEEDDMADDVVEGMDEEEGWRFMVEGMDWEAV